MTSLESIPRLFLGHTRAFTVFQQARIFSDTPLPTHTPLPVWNAQFSEHSGDTHLYGAQAGTY